MEMNIQMINRLLSEHSTNSQYQLMQIFDRLSGDENGWKNCTMFLINETHTLISQTIFYFLRVVEHFVTHRYPHASAEDREWLRKFFGTWLDRNLQQPGFVRNKTAQLLALMCVSDCPSGQWSSFFDDLINFASAYGCDQPLAVDMVLRVLKALDSEVADRDISHTAERSERNTAVKDWMRDNCVQKLAVWWLHVLTNFKERQDQASLTCFCLEIISLYISWVEINLVANDAYLAVFLELLRRQSGLCREAVCDCLSAVVSKGMPAGAKVQLVQQLSEQLSRAGVFEIIGIPGAGVPQGAVGMEDVEYLSKLSSLVNQMGLQVMDSYNAFVKANDVEEANKALNEFEGKVDLSLNLLAYDDEEVSRNVAPLMQNYLSLLKPLAQQGLSDTTKVRIETIMRTIFSRLKYDKLYDFDNEGEEEAIFQDYRKTVRVLMTNMIQLAPDLVLRETRLFLSYTLDNWKTLEWNDVELAIALFFQLGEAVSVMTMSLASASPTKPASSSSVRKRAPPNPVNVEQAEAIREMLLLLCRSGVVAHPHPAVIQQYFETVARYERVFSALDKTLLQAVMMEFLGEQGLRSCKDRVRVRCAYLFSRFVRTHKTAMEDPGFAEGILTQLQPLLTLPSAPDRVATNSPCSSLDSDSGASSCSDHAITAAVTEQGYLFETAAFIVVVCNISTERKAQLVTEMLSPIVTQVPKLSSRMIADSNKGCKGNPRLQNLLAEALRTCMDYACRSSKAFTSTSTIEQCGCVEIYSQTLRIFIDALRDIPVTLVEPRSVVSTGLRVYLHRLVVCLGENIIQQFGTAARELLSTAGVRDLSDLLPLLNQLMTKYKHRVQTTVSQLLGLLISRVLSCLTVEGSHEDMQTVEEHRRLRRSFYSFVGTVVGTQPIEVLVSQEPSLQHELLNNVVGGAMDVTDPQAQKTAFTVLRLLVTAMPGSEAFHGFLLQQVIPACLVTPACPGFDLRDAQTLLVLNESAACQKAVLEKLGENLLRYLVSEALPRLSVPPPVANDYVQALKHWNLKQFQQFLKRFYTDGRQLAQQQAPS